ncbi:G-D-S-L family lipolytic protein [Sinomicrobium weinanense]|uniref:G-D-S-L family lipolytic protein n=1 Tax=Sinomicrobium weinanense TaxID=2842200 RepID=A0A926JUT9_9FLAO|nr:G-D-S-L family lipolytic protein [Sinomicrobium weinanense]MBC9797957.1 G-D-S-L family lipolytic protein [Sinomicrobium weinanense]MBU3123107.1 G-D-S-L family lipolytic protein [Sinomicrobium weinanense]
MKKNIRLLALLALGLAACQPEFDKPVDESGFYSAGDADFSNYVAVGNSLTAGFADNALYIQGQENSYPNIMAQQFAHVGGRDFIQPLMNDNIGGLLAGGTQIADTRMVLNATDTTFVNLDEQPTTDIANTLQGPFNNMGVPGAKIYHLVAEGYGDISGVGSTANPYFVRFASSAGTSVIADAAAQTPTFFTLWIGNNDILSYATSGGVGVDRTGDTNLANYRSNDITDPNVFAAVYDQLLTALAGSGAKGAVANIPDVTSIPYFTTVPYAPVPMDAGTAAYVNSQYQDYNNAMLQYAALGLITQEEAQRRQINFQEGQNPVVITDEYLTALPNPQGGEMPKIRQTTPEDLIVLTAQTHIGQDPDDPSIIHGVSVPLEDQWVLTPEEQLLVSNAQTQYNATIKALAGQYELAFVDARAMMAQAAETGIPYDGGVLTSAYATGGAFSLDGVHPTAKGYALVANAFIEAINETYNSTIPGVNPGAYPDVFVK